MWPDQSYYNTKQQAQHHSKNFPFFYTHNFLTKWAYFPIYSIFLSSSSFAVIPSASACVGLGRALQSANPSIGLQEPARMFHGSLGTSKGFPLGLHRMSSSDLLQ